MILTTTGTVSPVIIQIGNVGLRDGNNQPLQLIHPTVDFDLNDLYDPESIDRVLPVIQQRLDDGEITVKDQQGNNVTNVDDLSTDFTLADAAAAAPVQSVEGRIGAIDVTKADVDLDQADNTSDADKPVSTAQGAAITGAIGAHEAAANPHTQYLISILQGTNISVDNTNPQNPEVSSSASGGGQNLGFGTLEYVGTTVPPGPGQISFNNANPDNASIVYISNQTIEGVDSGLLLANIVPGSTIRLPATDQFAALNLFISNSNVTDQGSYTEIELLSVSNVPQTYQPANGTIFNLIFDVVIPSAFPNGYFFRRPITIDPANVTGSLDHNNLPVLVTIQNNDFIAGGSKVQLGTTFSNSSANPANRIVDIAFFAANGTTQLSHELVEYNPLTGLVVAFVKVPVVSGSVPTLFHMYYGNEAVNSSQEDTVNVWKGHQLQGGSSWDWTFVLHMNRIITSEVNPETLNTEDHFKDSTENTVNPNVLNNGIAAQLVTGPWGSKRINANNSPWMTMTTNKGLPTGNAGTMIVFASFGNQTVDAVVATEGFGDNNGEMSWHMGIEDNEQFGARIDTVGGFNRSDGPAIPTGTDIMQSLVYDPSAGFPQAKKYLDGVQVATFGNLSGNFDTKNVPWQWFKRNGSNRFLNAEVQENRWVNGFAVPEQWQQTEAFMFKNPSIFAVIGPEQTP
jgi:hypothetical protein